MAYCARCEMDLAYCEHGLAARRKEASANEGRLLISRNGLAHFPGCPHKDDGNFNGWAVLDTPRAWERLGNGEQLAATGGARPDRIALDRCKDCVAHGPW